MVLLKLLVSPGGFGGLRTPLADHEWMEESRALPLFVSRAIALHLHINLAPPHRIPTLAAANTPQSSLYTTTATAPPNFAPHASISLVMGLAALSRARLFQSL